MRKDIDDPDQAARRSLRRHRALATGLLALMGAITIGSYALPASYGRELLQAAAKAGFVGGLADWFAVTALFRHPLGLPIPHTAILPRQKRRLGEALGRFMSRHVLTEAEIGGILGDVDIAAVLGRFLADPAVARPAAQAIAPLIPRLVGSIGDGRASRLVMRLLPRVIGRVDSSRLLGRALRALAQGGHHQAVLGLVLTELKAGLVSREGALQRAIEARVREQGGRLVGWAVGASVARRVLASLNTEFARMDLADSEMRQAFDEWTHREIERLMTDPERAGQLSAGLRRIIANEAMRVWLRSGIVQLRAALAEDAEKPNGGRAGQVIETLLTNLGLLLQTDPAAQARVRQVTLSMVAAALPGARARLADFIAGVIGRWDTATLVDRLELRVGRDLQYVRINGTLVGFLAGGALFAGLHWVFGLGF